MRSRWSDDSRRWALRTGSAPIGTMQRALTPFLQLCVLCALLLSGFMNRRSQRTQRVGGKFRRPLGISALWPVVFVDMEQQDQKAHDDRYDEVHAAV
jgi:hypothetical protein